MPLCDHDGSVLTINDCPAVVYMLQRSLLAATGHIRPTSLVSIALTLHKFALK